MGIPTEEALGHLLNCNTPGWGENEIQHKETKVRATGTGFVAGGFQSKRQEGIHVHVSIL